jgi:cytochrome c5
MKFIPKMVGIGMVVFGLSAPIVVVADGEADYNTVCFACHNAGVAGAPKLGDKENWAPRLEQGMETLYKHTIEGYQGEVGYMPPRGGSSLSDEAIKGVVDYMVSTVQ